MKYWLPAPLLLLLLLAPIPGMARPIIADLSEDTIRIDSSFAGKDLLLFGARNDPGDVVIVMRGPLRNYVLHKKERVLGMWINTAQTRFYGVPEFYKIASTRPLSAIASHDMRAALGIGADFIGLMPNKPLPDALAQEFREAFLARQERRDLFRPNDVVGLSFMGESLFKLLLSFPDNIPRGAYTAEVYLFSDGQLEGVQSIPLTVLRTGFDAFIADLAWRFPVLYGLLALLVATLAGWAGSTLFRKKV